MLSTSHHKIYSGRRNKAGLCIVHVQSKGDSYLLPLRLDIVKHSPTGFEWGYGGSGPSQLALAILADCVSDEVALALHIKFKMQFVAKLHRDRPWKLGDKQVVQFVLANMKPLKQQEES
jgi:hypothetical protein